jgi:hypothetical protein
MPRDTSRESVLVHTIIVPCGFTGLAGTVGVLSKVIHCQDEGRKQKRVRHLRIGLVKTHNVFKGKKPCKEENGAYIIAAPR